MVATYQVEGMKWAVMKVKESGQWLLLDSAITDTALDTMDAAEAEYGLPWTALLKKDFYLVRLNRAKDGSPTDLMWAWGQKPPNLPDVIPYDEDIVRFHEIVVKSND